MKDLNFENRMNDVQPLIPCTVQTFKDGVCQQEHTSEILWEPRHIYSCITILSNCMDSPSWDRVVIRVG